MSNPSPARGPRKDPDSGRPHDQPLVPPDDPNADRVDRVPNIDPPPTDPAIKAPSEEPGTVEPPARACGREVITWTRGDTPCQVGVWTIVGSFRRRDSDRGLEGWH
jgi:hypothetical protein